MANIPKGTADGQVAVWSAADQAWKPQASPAGAPAGADREVQFNDSGAFGAESNMSYLAPTATERYLTLEAPGGGSGIGGYRVNDSASVFQGEVVYDEDDGVFYVRSATNADMEVASQGTGLLEIVGGGGLTLNGGIDTLVWPDSDGGANELLFTDGAGVLDWVARAGVDTTAIHDNVAAEINAVATKATPVGADVVLIEDSAAGFVKKKALLSSLPGGGGGGGARSFPYYGPRVRNQFNSTNTIYLVRIIAPATMTLTDLSFFVSSTSGTDNWLFGIYNAALTSLLREGSFTPSTAGWVTNALSSGLAITEGTQYWVAWKGTNGGANIGGATDNFTNQNNTRSLFNSGSSLPASAAAATAASNIYNFYLNGDI